MGSDGTFSVNGRSYGAHPFLIKHQDYRITKFIKHPGFTESSNNFLYNDIALVSIASMHHCKLLQIIFVFIWTDEWWKILMVEFIIVFSLFDPTSDFANM